MSRYFATAECGFQGYFAEGVQLGQIAATHCQVSVSQRTGKADGRCRIVTAFLMAISYNLNILKWKRFGKTLEVHYN
jgi:hypothetical protein